MKTIFSYIFCLLFSVHSFSQASLEGVTFDEDSITLPFTAIGVYQNDTLVTGTTSDIDGYYFIDSLDEGYYTIKVYSYLSDLVLTDIKLTNNETKVFNYFLKNEIKLSICGPTYPADYYNWWKQTKYDINDVEINEFKYKKLNKIISNSPSVTLNKNNELSFKGSRPGSEQYIIDGMTVYGKANIPTSSISDINIYYNGIPAKYGNTTSAVIDIKSKSFFDFFD